MCERRLKTILFFFWAHVLDRYFSLFRNEKSVMFNDVSLCFTRFSLYILTFVMLNCLNNFSFIVEFK